MIRSATVWSRKTGGPPAVWIVLIGTLILLGAPALTAQVESEQAVRAAFVFNLTKFVEWPIRGEALTVGFVGDGPMGKTLKQMLTGKLSGTRPIQVMLSPPDEALERCDIVYVAYTSESKTRAVIERLGNRSILTVGDTGSFTRKGGMIGLVTIGDQVRLEINMKAVQAARLTISSRLLHLATITVPAPDN